MKKLWTGILVITAVVIGLFLNEQEDKLKKVLIVFRHGDRAPTIPSYPTDPHRHYVWEGGLGNMTTVGKMHCIELGKFIRHTYSDLLTLNVNEVIAKSSSVWRTVISSVCVLVGIYSPNNTTDCFQNSAFRLLPVYTIYPLENDRMLHYDPHCASLAQEVRQIRSSPEFAKKIAKHKGLLEELRQLTGDSTLDHRSIRLLDDTLIVQDAHNLTWPSWAHRLKPEIDDLCHYVNNLLTRMGPVAKAAAGVLLSELLVRTKEDAPSYKLYLYATHDLTMMSLLKLVHVFNDVRVPTSAALIIEVYSKWTWWTKHDYVQLYYRNTSTGSPHKLSVEGCAEPCTVHAFTELTRVNAVDDYRRACALTN